MNIVIPMAGRGSRFREAGYEKPKPFIELNGVPMILWIIKNIYVVEPMHFFLLHQEEHTPYMNFLDFTGIDPSYHLVPVKGITEGAACTVLLAEQHINNNEELLIANSDQLVDWDDVQKAVALFRENDAAGGVLTFLNDHPKWSYVALKDGRITEIAEKRVISNVATVGIYYFRRGRDFVWAAKEMMKDNAKRVNSEWYVAPAINELIARGDKILPYFVNNMIGLGTPEDFHEAQKKLA